MLRIKVNVANHHSSVGTNASEAAPGSSIPTITLPDPWPSSGNLLHWDAFFNHAVTPPIPSQLKAGVHDAQPIDLDSWTTDFFGDAIFDWIGWDDHISDFNVDAGICTDRI